MAGRRGPPSDDVAEGRRRRAGRVALGAGAALLLVAVALLLGGKPRRLLELVADAPPVAPSGPNARRPPAPEAYDEQADLVAAVLAETERTWRRIFAEMGTQYIAPKLVLFAGAIDGACGAGSPAIGPFYCAADQTIYVDLDFLRALDEDDGIEGDAAQAYVIAHAVGHHVQTLLGIGDRVAAMRRRAGPGAARAVTVREELQADCFAGVFAHHAARGGLLEPREVEEGLAAAAAVAEDRARGAAAPESWRHGSLEQRVRWLLRGIELGRPDRCDTFGADLL